MGPGSYTGLRVGMATAKGLCYALNKPLIIIGSLDVLAYQAIKELPLTNNAIPTLFRPMIDARRMEVFTALFELNGSLRSPDISLGCGRIWNRTSTSSKGDFKTGEWH